jgi:hypothetical protein
MKFEHNLLPLKYPEKRRAAVVVEKTKFETTRLFTL